MLVFQQITQIRAVRLSLELMPAADRIQPLGQEPCRLAFVVVR